MRSLIIRILGDSFHTAENLPRSLTVFNISRQWFSGFDNWMSACCYWCILPDLKCWWIIERNTPIIASAHWIKSDLFDIRKIVFWNPRAIALAFDRIDRAQSIWSRADRVLRVATCDFSCLGWPNRVRSWCCGTANDIIIVPPFYPSRDQSSRYPTRLIRKFPAHAIDECNLRRRQKREEFWTSSSSSSSSLSSSPSSPS